MTRPQESVPELIVIGSSWGGMHALRVVLGALPPEMPPIVVAQHRGPDGPGGSLAAQLAMLSAGTLLDIADAEDKEPLRRGTVRLAPADYHLLIDGGRLALSTEAPVRFSRPSIDVLFESAAEACGSATAAVVLTGANADGAAGLRAIRQAGGWTLAQDPRDAERPEMPAAAIAAGCVDEVLPLDAVGVRLAGRCAGALS